MNTVLSLFARLFGKHSQTNGNKAKTLEEITDIRKTLESISDKNMDLSFRIRQIEELSKAYLNTKQEEELTFPRIAGMDNIKSFIDENYRNGNFSIQTVMDHFGMTHSNLSHQFKSYMGENISSYINTLKMNYAKELLSAGNLTVNEIGRKLGYFQTSSFIKRFKSTEGLTPGEYRSKFCDSSYEVH